MLDRERTYCDHCIGKNLDNLAEFVNAHVPGFLQAFTLGNHAS